MKVKRRNLFLSIADSRSISAQINLVLGIEGAAAVSGIDPAGRRQLLPRREGQQMNPARSMPDPQYWRQRAAMALALAEQVDDPRRKTDWSRIAENYEQAAEHARRRTAAK